ncbi:MAG: helix-turn-helix domain-containing protein [Burkholderiales bacterium]|nr:helix-turn-helix domain-containing protein [Burkholderiales bacterium]
MKPKQTAVKAAVPAGTDGTQAIRRAGAMLRTIAKAGTDGISLAEIARAEELPRSTVHRILKCLVEEGFVEQPGDGKRYQMGRLIHELGLTSASGSMEVARWRHVVEAVARRTGVTSYLMRRSGVESVCIVKADGNSLVRFVPVEVGQRRLLGVGAGATALLAALEPGQTEHVIHTITPGLARYPRLDAASVRAAVKLVRRSGFAISQGTVVDDGFGMGMAVPDAGGQPHLAISIAAHATLVTESAISNWKKVIAEEIQLGLRVKP